jgi:hypothetical protein
MTDQQSKSTQKEIDSKDFSELLRAYSSEKNHSATL